MEFISTRLCSFAIFSFSGMPECTSHLLMIAQRRKCLLALPFYTVTCPSISCTTTTGIISYRSCHTAVWSSKDCWFFFFSFLSSDLSLFLILSPFRRGAFPSPSPYVSEWYLNSTSYLTGCVSLPPLCSPLTQLSHQYFHSVSFSFLVSFLAWIL